MILPRAFYGRCIPSAITIQVSLSHIHGYLFDQLMELSINAPILSSNRSGTDPNPAGCLLILFTIVQSPSLKATELTQTQFLRQAEMSFPFSSFPSSSHSSHYLPLSPFSAAVVISP